MKIGNWLVLPHPPSVNNMFATYRGRRIKSERAKAFAQEAGMLARIVFREPLSGPVEVRMVVYPMAARKMDIDNVLKATLDAMTGIVWADDSQVWKLTIERSEETRKDGGLCLYIETTDNG